MAISNSTDRFNKAVFSLAIKAPCVAVSTTNITLSGEQTVGAVAVVSGDRVLVTGQTDTTENGIYDASTSAWTRALDFDGNRDVTRGTLCPVTTTGEANLYEVTASDPITIGTSAITFSLRYSSAAEIAVLDDGTRGAAGTAGRVIYNTTDGNLNIDNGTNWILPNGTIT